MICVSYFSLVNYSLYFTKVIVGKIKGAFIKSLEKYQPIHIFYIKRSVL